MNLNNLGVVLLVFLMLVAMLASFIYYLRHWTQRQQRLANDIITEGQFFKRYVPTTLRVAYDARRQQQSERLRRHFNVLRIAMMAIAGGGLVAVVFFAVFENWSHIIQIDLTDREIAALDYSQNHWLRKINNQLPQLDTLLPLLRKHGVALISARSDRQWRVAGRSLTNAARTQWQKFLQQNKVPYHNCVWKGLSRCGRTDIYIALPGQWNREVIDKLLKRGVNLLLYGPPAPLFTHKDRIEFYGLNFIPRSFPGMQQLAIAGDRELTLGFDAGLIILATPSFDGYMAQSTQPQAIGINDTRFIGGVIQTRLYAQTIGKGHLVWMDFSPNSDDHPEALNSNLLAALNATVFRFLLHRPYSAWASWPNGKRFAGTLSEDTEERFSRAKEILTLVHKLDVPITWFILSNVAQKFPALTRQLADAGEIACHGDSHASFIGGDRANQIRRIARCRKVLTEITGVTPIAFRPPSEEYNSDTVDAVANNGMSYYFAEAGGDRAVPVLEQSSGKSKVLVSLPRICADDFEMWHTRKLGFSESIDRADSDLHWTDTLGGLLMFDFHTQNVSDEHLKVITHYVQRLKQEDVFLSSAGEIASWWQERDRLVHGESIAQTRYDRYRPVLLMVDEDGRLNRIRDPAQQTALLTSTDAKPQSVANR